VESAKGRLTLQNGGSVTVDANRDDIAMAGL
jgi:hypothetical protein